MPTKGAPSASQAGPSAKGTAAVESGTQAVAGPTAAGLKKFWGSAADTDTSLPVENAKDSSKIALPSKQAKLKGKENAALVGATSDGSGAVGLLSKSASLNAKSKATANTTATKAAKPAGSRQVNTLLNYGSGGKSNTIDMTLADQSVVTDTPMIVIDDADGVDDVVEVVMEASKLPPKPSGPPRTLELSTTADLFLTKEQKRVKEEERKRKEEETRKIIEAAQPTPLLIAPVTPAEPWYSGLKNKSALQKKNSGGNLAKQDSEFPAPFPSVHNVGIPDIQAFRDICTQSSLPLIPLLYTRSCPSGTIIDLSGSPSDHSESSLLPSVMSQLRIADIGSVFADPWMPDSRIVIPVTADVFINPAFNASLRGMWSLWIASLLPMASPAITIDLSQSSSVVNESSSKAPFTLTHTAKSLQNWMEILVGKRRASRRSRSQRKRLSSERRRRSTSLSTDDCDDVATPNVLFLRGPTGTGKTHTVVEAAHAVGLKVLHISVSDLCSAQELFSICSEATQSHGIVFISNNETFGSQPLEAPVGAPSSEVIPPKSTSKSSLSGTIGKSAAKGLSLKSSGANSSSGKAPNALSTPGFNDKLSVCSATTGAAGAGSEMTLILLDEADLVLAEPEVAKRISTAIVQLASSSKNPVVITSESPHWQLLPKSTLSGNLMSVGSGLLTYETLAMQRPRRQQACNMALTTLAKDQQDKFMVCPGASVTDSGSVAFASVANAAVGLLCLLSDGDVRAAASNILLSKKPLVGLAETPATLSFSQPQSAAASGDSPAVGSMFYLWMAAQSVDVAVFDLSLYTTSIGICQQFPEYSVVPTVIDGIEGKRERIVNAPLVNSVNPCNGLVSGGFHIKINGKYFLQSAHTNSSAIEARAVKVFLGGSECTSVIESDSVIHAIVPAMPSPGIYTVIVHVYHEFSTRELASYISSAVYGEAGGLVQLQTPGCSDTRARMFEYFERIHRQRREAEAASFLRKDSNSDDDDSIHDSDEESSDNSDFNSSPEANRKRSKGAMRQGEKAPLVVTIKKSKQNPELNRRANKKRVIDDDEDDEEVQIQVQNGASSAGANDKITSSEEAKFDGEQNFNDQATSNEPLNELDVIHAELMDALTVMVQYVVDVLLKHRNFVAFFEPVCPEANPEYYKEIANPMDLTTLATELATGTLPVMDSAELDPTLEIPVINCLGVLMVRARLIRDNCIQFNGEHSSLGKRSISLAEIFDDLIAECLLNIPDVVNNRFLLRIPGSRLRVSWTIEGTGLVVEDASLMQNQSMNAVLGDAGTMLKVFIADATISSHIQKFHGGLGEALPVFSHPSIILKEQLQLVSGTTIARSTQPMELALFTDEAHYFDETVVMSLNSPVSNSNATPAVGLENTDEDCVPVIFSYELGALDASAARGQLMALELLSDFYDGMSAADVFERHAVSLARPFDDQEDVIAKEQFSVARCLSIASKRLLDHSIQSSFKKVLEHNSQLDLEASIMSNMLKSIAVIRDQWAAPSFKRDDENYPNSPCLGLPLQASSSSGSLQCVSGHSVDQSAVHISASSKQAKIGVDEDSEKFLDTESEGDELGDDEGIDSSDGDSGSDNGQTSSLASLSTPATAFHSTLATDSSRINDSHCIHRFSHDLFDRSNYLLFIKKKEKFISFFKRLDHGGFTSSWLDHRQAWFARTVHPVMALDIIPLIGHMLLSEKTRYLFNSSFHGQAVNAGSRSTRRSKTLRSVFSITLEITNLSESQLENWIHFAFMDDNRQACCKVLVDQQPSWI